MLLQNMLFDLEHASCQVLKTFQLEACRIFTRLVEEVKERAHYRNQKESFSALLFWNLPYMQACALE